MHKKPRLYGKMLGKSSVIAGLLFAVTACFPTSEAAPTPTPLPPATSYEKASFTVEKGPIVSEVSLDGHVWPSQHDELHFLADGYVARVTVSEGDEVKADGLLAELQVDDLTSQLEQAQIDLEAAKSESAKQKKNQQFAIERAQRQVNIEQLRVEMARLVVEATAETSSELTASQLQLALAEENLALAKIALAEASVDSGQSQQQAIERKELEVDRLEGQLAERQIVTPYDAVILERRIAPGDQVFAFGTALIVGDPTELVVRARQEPQLLGTVDEDSEIWLHVTNGRTERYAVRLLPGFLPRNRDSAENRAVNPDWVYFSTPLSVGSDSLPIGKSVQLTVVLGRADDVLLVPPEAVHEFRGRQYVIVRDGERQRRVDVRVGLKTDDYWEIIGDVQNGDQVIGP